MALSSVELEAIRRFARSPEGRGWVQLLEKKLAESDIKMRSLTGEHLYRQQGRSLELAELLNDIEGADKVLNRQDLTARPRPTRTQL